MDNQEWTQIVTAATRAPSIHNTQPWLFTASPDRLVVHTDPARALAVLDPTGRQRIISCGVAVEFARVAIRAAGYTVDVELLPDADDPDHLADLDVGAPGTATEEERQMLAAVDRRHTQHAAFLPQSVPPDVIDRLHAEVTAFGVWMKTMTLTEEEVAAVSSSRGPRRSSRGIRPTSPGWRAGYGPIRRRSTACRGPRCPATTPRRGRPTDSSATTPPPPVERLAVLLLGTDNDDRRAWSEVGRALGRLLLRATSEGLAASPLTQALDSPATRAQMRSRPSLVGHPQMLSRVGYPEDRGSPADDDLSATCCVSPERHTV